MATETGGFGRCFWGVPSPWVPRQLALRLNRLVVRTQSHCPEATVASEKGVLTETDCPTSGIVTHTPSHGVNTHKYGTSTFLPFYPLNP
jgi:hypothetical protein